MKLLPQVQEIAWEQRHTRIDPYITLLLSQTTYSLDLGLKPPLDLSDEEKAQYQRTQLSVLRTVPASSPHITHLTLSAVMVKLHWPDVRDAFENLNFWPSLQYLTLHNFPKMSAAIICNIPNLRALSLYGPLLKRRLPSLVPSNFRGFSRLQDLRIWSSCRIELFALTIMHNTPLRYLDIQLFNPSPDKYWKRLFDGMHNGIAHASLAMVRVYDARPTFGPDDRNPVTLEDMSGIFVFTNLTQLDLTATYGFDLGDEQMRTLVLALPRLEQLLLQSYFPLPNGPRMTFEGLRSVALHCLKLERLAVAFDARNIVDSDICNVNTKSIKVLDSLIDDPAAVSAALLVTFPNLMNVQSWDEEALESTKWKEVDNLINLQRSDPSNS